MRARNLRAQNISRTSTPSDAPSPAQGYEVAYFTGNSHRFPLLWVEIKGCKYIMLEHYHIAHRALRRTLDDVFPAV